MLHSAFHLISTGFFQLFVPRLTDRGIAMRKRLVVKRHSLTQQGIAFTFVGLVDRHEQGFFLTDQQHPALGTGNSGIDQIPGQEDLVCRQHGNDSVRLSSG